ADEGECRNEAEDRAEGFHLPLNQSGANRQVDSRLAHRISGRMMEPAPCERTAPYHTRQLVSICTATRHGSVQPERGALIEYLYVNGHAKSLLESDGVLVRPNSWNRAVCLAYEAVDIGSVSQRVLWGAATKAPLRVMTLPPNH